MSDHGAEAASGPRSPDVKEKIPSRVVMSEVELSKASAGELVSNWRLQDSYVSSLEQRLAQQEGRYCLHSEVEFFDYKIINYGLSWEACGRLPFLLPKYVATQRVRCSVVRIGEVRSRR